METTQAPNFFDKCMKSLVSNQTFKKTFKMVTYEDFKEDPNNLIEHIKKFFKEHEGYLPFPARMCGATVTCFKPLT